MVVRRPQTIMFFFIIILPCCAVNRNVNVKSKLRWLHRVIIYHMARATAIF